MTPVGPVVVVAPHSDLAKASAASQGAPPRALGLGLGLVGGGDLIDPPLEQRSEDLESRLPEPLPKPRLHCEQRRRQILQQRVDDYLEFLGERLVEGRSCFFFESFSQSARVRSTLS